MTGADAQSDIKRELADAVKTAGAYLGALKKVLDPDTISTPEYRRREIRIMRNDDPERLDVGPRFCPAIRLRATPPYWDASTCIVGVTLKFSNPFSKGIGSHPAYREALEIIVGRIRDTGAATPERLRRWEKERGEVKGRWSPKAARDDLIGSVIEAMATGQKLLLSPSRP